MVPSDLHYNGLAFDPHSVNDTIIRAIIKKANLICPDSLALIGIYGSYATGDVHKGSDLDLLILINNDNGWKLADAFILDDSNIGYDIYCTSWDMLKEDAKCNHAHLSKLLDSKIVYINDQTALQKLYELRSKANGILSSDDRFFCVQRILSHAKESFGECVLSDSLSQIRTLSGKCILLLLDAIMLYHGKYFKLGVKRTLAELSQLPLKFNIEASVLCIICANSSEEIKIKLKEFFKSVTEHIVIQSERKTASADCLWGTYEEMYSNWKNKMQEAEISTDVYSSFMNLLSLQNMIHELAHDTTVPDQEIMDSFTPENLSYNTKVFDSALKAYLAIYEEIGLSPRKHADVAAFYSAYTSEPNTTVQT